MGKVIASLDAMQAKDPAQTAWVQLQWGTDERAEE